MTGGYCSKKGGVSDLILYVIIIVVVAFVGLITLRLMTQLDDNFQANSQLSTEGKAITADIRARFADVVDNGFLIVLIGFALAIIIGASIIYTHPALYWISIPIIVFIVFMAAMYSNIFYNFYTDGGFSAEIGSLTIMKFVMDKFPIFITVIALVVAFVLYGKSRVQSGYG